MNLNLFRKSLKEIRVSWPSYALGMVLYVFLLMSIYPSLQERSEEIKRLIENYPEGFLRVFGGGDVPDFATVEGFLSLELFAFMWFIIIGAFVISYGTGAIGKEFDNGTIEILLSQPISRTRMLITKGITLFAGTVGLVTITMLSTYLIGAVYDVNPKPEGIVALGIIGSLFFLALASISLFFSVLFGERGRAAQASAGILTVMYLLTTLSEYADWAKDLDIISLFHYYNSTKLLGTGDIPLASLLVFGGVIVVFLVGAGLVFSRRDIAV